MTDISWLADKRLTSIVKNEFTWGFVFSDGTNLQVECLWRLLESGHVALTSEDHGQQFGLPAPVDCVTEISNRLGSAEIVSAIVKEGTLDVSIVFSSGHILELIPDSSGYEAWNMGSKKLSMVAQGGGKVVILNH